jgi:hypothetical protein
LATSTEILDNLETSTQAEQCRNCDAQLLGKFCHHCGQKEFLRHDFTLKHFFGHFLHEFTHLDSNKIITTLAAFLFKPGLLAEQYLAGRKGRYINPIRVYLTISALYFFFAWGALLQSGGVSVKSIASQKHVIAMAQTRAVEPHFLAEKVLQKAEKYSAILRFSSVLLSGLFLMALYFRAKRYYVEHLVFSLYFYSFDFFLRSSIAVLFIIGAAMGFTIPAAVRSLFYIGIFLYLLFALRRVYKESWVRTSLKSVGLFIFEILLFIAVNMAGFILAYSLV